MTKEIIVEIAKIAGFIKRHDCDEWICNTSNIERLYGLAIVAENEYCSRRADIALLGSDRTLRNRVIKAIETRSEK